MSTSVLEIGAIGVGTDNEALHLKTRNTLRWAASRFQKLMSYETGSVEVLKFVSSVR